MGDVLEQLKEHRAEFRIFCTQMIGSPTDDKPYGRVPRLESRMDNHERRIGNLERWRWKLAGAIGILVVALWGTDPITHLSHVFR